MLPIGPLMIEHRLIERMVGLLKKELIGIDEAKYVDPRLIDVWVDFFRMYADRCHHGKEEGILFRELGKKQLSDELLAMMNELVKEHIFARNTVRSLESAKASYAPGKTESLKEILKILTVLVEFYPLHIEKEDKRFFVPCMEYFTKEEQDAMLEEFWEFDRKLIHEKYKEIVDRVNGG